MISKSVAVVILNWNGRFFLEKFLPNVIKYSIDIADIIIADNGSNDDSVEYLNQNFPQVKIIQLDKNYGFAKGYNIALNQIDAKYFILLNSDVEVTENWIKPIIDLFESDEKIAAVQPKLLAYNDRNYFEYAGAAGGFIDKYGYPFCRGRIFQNIETDNGQYEDIEEIFWASGACLFIKADVYKKFSGFDDDFFAHMEEIDLCWRLKNADYKIMYSCKSTVYHVGGGTLPKKSARKTYLNFRNNLFLLYKNLPSNKLYIVFFVRFFLDLVAAFKFLIDGSFKDFEAVFKAHYHYILNLRKLKKKRQNIIHKNTPHIYKGNIVWDYYIKKIVSFKDLRF